MRTTVRSYLAAKNIVLPPWVYETATGFKYWGTGYYSHLFAHHVKQSIEFERTKIEFDDLLLPPDGLKNSYSNAGVGITQSPHFHLMDDLERAEKPHNIKYIQLCNLGLLDNRRPFQISYDYLNQTFVARKAMLEAGTRFDVVVFQLKDGSGKAVIADGKHRAALAAYTQSRDALCLKIISVNPFKELFFRRYYQALLKANPKDYSHNQNLIKRIFS